MTQVDMRYLTPVLELRHATAVESEPERKRLAKAVDEASEGIVGFISPYGRVLAAELKSGKRVIYVGEIETTDDGWEPTGTASIYELTTDDHDQIRDDAKRLFLAQTLELDAALRFGGWRDRIVALVPEEVGPKEATIIRTLPDGQIETTHTFNVLDAFGMYSRWVSELALEFGSVEELARITRWSPELQAEQQAEAEVKHIVQAWLMREAAEAQLEQARGSLKFGLGAHARLLKYTERPHLSISELARSFYTDRPNLTRVVKTAEHDARLVHLFDAIESSEPRRILATLREKS